VQTAFDTLARRGILLEFLLEVGCHLLEIDLLKNFIHGFGTDRGLEYRRELHRELVVLDFGKNAERHEIYQVFLGSRKELLQLVLLFGRIKGLHADLVLVVEFLQDAVFFRLVNFRDNVTGKVDNFLELIDRNIQQRRHA
jgi:hypothetical protein